MKKPTVTELIDLLNKPALMFWANKIGLQGIDLKTYQKEKKETGTSLHRQIQNKILNNQEITDEQLRANFEIFEQKVKITDVEKPIETEYFTGRFDIRFSYKDKTFISDFKSSNAIYLENKLQLCAYKMSHPECSIAITRIPEMITTPVIFDFEKGKEILICLSKIYELKQLI